MGRVVWLATAIVLSTIFHPDGAVGQTVYSRDDMVAEHLVRLQDGRRMNLACIGSGEPTVVFEQGLGESIVSWGRVAPTIAHDTKTCVYDRAGQGYSDPSPKPMTALNVIEDLKATLLASGIKTPVILVGHSIGGLYATLYADRFFGAVAGLVLVDPSFSGQDAEALNSPLRTQMDAAFKESQRFWTRCAEVASSGKLSENNADCPWTLSNLTPRVHAYLYHQFSLPFMYQSYASENGEFYSAEPGRSEDALEENALRRNFGSLPLVVLTAGIDESWPAAVPKIEVKEMADTWRRGHEDLAARSTKGQSLVVDKAGHFIQLQQPDAVIAAIQAVLNEARLAVTCP